MLGNPVVVEVGFDTFIMFVVCSCYADYHDGGCKCDDLLVVLREIISYGVKYVGVEVGFNTFLMVVVCSCYTDYNYCGRRRDGCVGSIEGDNIIGWGNLQEYR